MGTRTACTHHTRTQLLAWVPTGTWLPRMRRPLVGGGRSHGGANIQAGEAARRLQIFAYASERRENGTSERERDTFFSSLFLLVVFSERRAFKGGIGFECSACCRRRCAPIVGGRQSARCRLLPSSPVAGAAEWSPPRREQASPLRLTGFLFLLIVLEHTRASFCCDLAELSFIMAHRNEGEA